MHVCYDKYGTPILLTTYDTFPKLECPDIL